MQKIIRAALSSFFIAGLLAVSGFSTYLWVSAAPAKVPQQLTQPTIGKLNFIYKKSSAGNQTTKADWPTPDAKPPVFTLPAGVSSFQLVAQLNSGSYKVPTWYAFDRFTVDKSLDQAALQQLVAKKAAAKEKSNAWKKDRTVKLTLGKIDPSQNFVVAAYAMNNDPTGESGVGGIDSIAYAFIQSADAAGGGAQNPPAPPQPAAGDAAELSVSLSANNPAPQQLVMGASNQPLYSFKLSANSADDVAVSQLALALSFTNTESAKNADSLLGALKNFRLYDGDKPVGSVVAKVLKLDNTESGQGFVVFKDLNTTVLKGSSKTYTVMADVAASPDLFAGVQFFAAIVPQLKLGENKPAFVAKGVTGGTAAKVVEPTGVKLSGSTMTILKTKITVAHAMSAPSGATSKSSQQTVAKFVVSNAANVNNQDAEIVVLRPHFASTIMIPSGKKRTAKIYSGEYPKADSMISSRAISSFPDSFTADDMESTVAIESGSAQTFIVIFDSSDAASGDTLSVSLPQGSVIWADGALDEIKFVDALPLTGKTLAY
ncbi:MAG: hypothetical protein A3C15_01615 [Candidatus Magasanikbacteria bacterium RIFCSPHIGHO2_02_FULL_50_9b]|uniref:Uncharacterized protein n=1 Tax=Candidatus Magasanikbacteria bacterium RIFCSPHIGHO2_02_FULL_50_9b TaxID=1798682 RepID=A0A1F6M9A2_9BACT|nr:MAG: hypothetical protein A3C15_01615 [Candidatus Magasanikbacteria bacterium RIFCSPHIGHO2_02_FULL_50_9b]